jgi:hypothetical protein
MSSRPDAQRLRGVPACGEPADEARIPAEACDPSQQTSVMGGPVRGREQEEEHEYRLAVHRVEFHAIGCDAEENRRIFDRGGEGVRHRDPVSDTRAEYLLARQKRCQHGLRIPNGPVSQQRLQKAGEDVPHVPGPHAGDHAFRGQVV